MPPCAVFAGWRVLKAEGFPNTADDLRSEQIRLVRATGSPLRDGERAPL